MNSKMYFPATFFIFCVTYIIVTDSAMFIKGFMGIAAMVFLLLTLRAKSRGGDK